MWEPGISSRTEKVFNDLVLLNGDVKDSGITITYTTSRFSYIYDKASQTGTGYMDVLLDETKHNGYTGNLSDFFCLLKMKTEVACKER